MGSLLANTHVKHFLLGNNIIGPSGALHIANFISTQPAKVETWYLAGNCIDAPSFEILVDSLIQSPSVTNVWLKRNPLTASSASALFSLITQTPRLRTLDLDQTTLGDKGVSDLFTALAAHEPYAPLPLRHLYLNGNGISNLGCTALATYLGSSHCTLESLYLGANPLGNKGCISLAVGLAQNNTLLRLCVPSTGISSAGCSAIVSSLKYHPQLTVLDLGQAFATQDLGQRYNYLTDEMVEDITAYLSNSKTIRLLNLGTQPLSHASISALNSAVAQSKTLLHYLAKSTFPQPKGVNGTTKTQSDFVAYEARATLARNVRNYYLDKEGKGMSYGEFMEGPLRFWRSPDDVRKIDSVYRNRDAGLARRGLIKLEKDWAEGEEGLEALLA